jgi:radical SAM superfamily enzyme YgiQ (UPF0313 family)
MEKAYSFEQGPIRPPSEAGSLLIRVTRNCPWNKCAFCSTYKKGKFSRRSMDEIKSDVDAVDNIRQEIERISHDMGEGGRLTRPVFSHVMSSPGLPDTFRSVGLWMASGGDTVFLQDANSIMLSTDKLVEIINYIKEKFPHVQRVTTYGRAGSVQKKSPEDYKRLKEAGLSRIHMGVESGADKILKMIDKGATAEQIIRGGQNARGGGVSICFYIIPGIGGVELSDENAIESARVIDEANPDFVRFRSLFVKRGSLLHRMVTDSEFQVPSEDQVVKEIKKLIENIEKAQTTLVSDHVLNLLEEVQGKLPEEKERILAVIDEYLDAPEEERLLYQLGRRGAGLRRFREVKDPSNRARLLDAKEQIDRELEGGVTEYLDEMKNRFL